MSESKKGVHQIDLNHFLFYNSPEIFYSLVFELVEPNKIRVILIKILESDTYIYEAEVPFTEFGTDDSSPSEALKKISYLIYNYNFVIKEDLNKANLYIKTKKTANIELFKHDQNQNQDIDLYYNEEINKLQNKIQELLNTIRMQEQKINELQKTEEAHLNMINNMEQVTKNLSIRLENLNNINNNNNNQNNNQYSNNQYNNSNQYSNLNLFNSNQYNNNNCQYKTNNNPYNTINANNPYSTNNINNPYNLNNNNANNPYRTQISKYPYQFNRGLMGPQNSNFNNINNNYPNNSVNSNNFNPYSNPYSTNNNNH